MVLDFSLGSQALVHIVKGGYTTGSLEDVGIRGLTLGASKCLVPTDTGQW